MIVVPNETSWPLSARESRSRTRSRRPTKFSTHSGHQLLISVTGLVNVDFADVRTVMREAAPP